MVKLAPKCSETKCQKNNHRITVHCEKKNIIISETNKDIAIFGELFPIIKGKECVLSCIFRFVDAKCVYVVCTWNSVQSYILE